jgi:NTE family protein
MPAAGGQRTGLALGVGGVLGAAWMTGALAALQNRLPYPLGAIDLAVGTSVGSILVAALRCGVGAHDHAAQPASRFHPCR